MGPSPLHGLDFLVIIVYLCSVQGLGIYFMRRQRTAAEFLLASRSLGWFVIGFSLLSSLSSAIGYIIGPASFLEWGAVQLVGAIPPLLAFPIIYRVFVPFYTRLPVYDCYEYLENRFGSGVRVTVSAIFILWRICWMAFTTYLPAYAFHVAMGLPLTETVIVLGILTTAYTLLGGARAVVWADVVQAMIMFTGVLVAVGVLLRGTPGGLLGAFHSVKAAGALNSTTHIRGWTAGLGLGQKISVYLHQPVTLWSVICFTFISKFNSYGSDQVVIQRYLAARSVDDCKRGFVVNAIAYILYTWLFFVMSMCLLAYFRAHPLPTATPYESWFPYFIAHRMPVVLRGLILAAIYSCTQSTVSAGMSAGTAILYSNIYVKILGRDKTASVISDEIQRQQVCFSRLCVFGFGTVVTVLACTIQFMGTLFALMNRIVSNFAGIMISVFLLGMFSRRARSLGVAVGAVSGLAAQIIWGFGDKLGLLAKPMGYGWTSTVGFVTSVGVCYIVSMFEKAPPPERMNWLWKNVMALPPIHAATSGVSRSSAKIAEGEVVAR